MSAYVLLFILSTTAFMWLLKTPIYADEVFGVFRTSQFLASNPIEVVRTALLSSWLGWQGGRFISPLLHVFGNLGFLISYEFGVWSGIDQLTSYGIFRVVLTATIPLLIMNLVYRVASRAIDESSRLKLGMLAGILLPVVLVSNGGFNSPRSAPWAYTGALVLALIFTIALVRLAYAVKEKEIKASPLFLMAALGLLFGTTYELTQVFAPAAFALYVVARLAATNSRISLKRIMPILRSANSIVFIGFYLASTLAIRGISYLRCIDGCYAPANVQIQNLDLWSVLERAVGAFPLFGIQYWNLAGRPYSSGESASELAIPNVEIGNIFVSIVLFVFIYLLLSKSSNFTDKAAENAMQLLAVGTLIFGLALLFMVSLGFQSSQAVQESPLAFGSSGRDSLYLSLGVSMALFSIVSYLNSKLVKLLSRGPTKIARAVLSLFLVTLAYAVVTTNFEVTRAVSAGGPNYLLSRISTEITSPDLSQQGNLFRCDMVQLKLSSYPEWEGHDRLFVSGLYSTMKARHGIPFCSVPEDSLFEEYGANVK